MLHPRYPIEHSRLGLAPVHTLLVLAAAVLAVTWFSLPPSDPLPLAPQLPQAAEPLAHLLTPAPPTLRAARRDALVASVLVTPDGGTISRNPFAAATYDFKVKNNGTVSGAFELTPACSGAAVSVPSCRVQTANVVQLAPNESTFVTYGFTTLSRNLTGKVVLRARMVTDTTVKDTGYTNVFTFLSPEVTPDTFAKVRAATSSVTDTFTVKNWDVVSRSFNFVAVCTWEGAPLTCTRIPTTGTLSAGASGPVRVTYTTGALGTGGQIILKAIATANSSILDSGSVIAATHAKPGLTPNGTVVSDLGPRVPATVTFSIQNPGRASFTYGLTATCTGAAIPSAGCTVTPTSVTVGAGVRANADVQFTSGPTASTGQIKVVATLTGTTIKDSATIGVATKVLGVAVTPDGGSRTRTTKTAARDTFWIANTGQSYDSYNVTASCIGSAIVGPCVLNQQVTVAPGGQVPVWLDYATGMTGTSATIVARARSLTDSAAIADSGSIAVTVPTPVVTRGIDVGYGGSYQLVPNTGGQETVWFPVTNLGNGSSLFWKKVSCSGAGIVAGSCRVAAGTGGSETDSTTWAIVQDAVVPQAIWFDVVPNGQPGTVKMTWVDVFDPTVKDSASQLVYCCNATSAAMWTTPDVRQRVRPLDTQVVDTFAVTNMSGATHQYFPSVNQCPATVAVSCTISPSGSFALPSGQTQNVTLSYRTPTTPGAGRLVAGATDSVFTSMYDFGAVDVTVAPAGAAVAVTPDGATRKRPLSGTALVDTFVVTNTGIKADTFKLALTCATPPVVAGTCSALPGLSVSLGSGSSIGVLVTYNTAATGATGQIALAATSNSNYTATDKGTIDVITSTTAVGVVAVTPDSVYRTKNVSTTAAKDTFVVTNRGTAPDAIAISVNCDPAPIAGGSCSLSPASPLNLAAGASSSVVVTYITNASPASGLITLTGTSSIPGGTNDQGTIRLNTVVPSVIAVSVTPDSLVRVRKTSLTALTDTFVVRNTGNTAATYTLTLTCTSPPVSAGTCASNPASSIALNPGVSGNVVVTYNTAATAATGAISLTARSSTNSTIFDAGAVWVTTTSPTTIAVSVTPASTARSRSTNAVALSDTFTVTNTGSATESFTLSIACPSPMVAGSCAIAPRGPISLTSGGALAVVAAYNTQATPGAGSLQLTATSIANPTVSSTGSYVVTAAAPAVVAVDVVPNVGQKLLLATATPDSTRFFVKNTGNTSASFRFAFVCTGGAIQTNTCALNGASPATIAAGDSVPRAVTFTTGTTGGKTGRVDLFAKYMTDSLVADSAYFDVSTTSTVTTVAVRPDDSLRTGLAYGSALSAVFRVKNTGSVSGSFVSTPACSAGAICTTTAPNLPVTINAGDSATVNVGYTLAAGGDSGRVTLFANLNGNPSVTDSGSYIVKAKNAPTVTVALKAVNPLTTYARDNCLAIAMGPASASECGDLRVVHPLAAVRTYGTVRAPTLFYNSQFAHPFPVVAADVRPDSAITSIDSLEVTLKVKGLPKVVRKLTSTVLLAKRIARVQMAYDALADTTGVYPITVSVVSWRQNNAFVDTVTAAGQIAVVNRSNSRVGPGWWMAGVEQLVPVNIGRDTLLWVGGDGSTRMYTRDSLGSNNYCAEKVDAPEVISYVPADTAYYRYLKGGTKVRFRYPSGLHVQTINRLAHATVFGWDSATGNVPRLKSIVVPPGGTGLTYTLKYGGASLWLDSVLVPVTGTQKRHNSLSHDGSGRVTQIGLPDLSAVGFVYHATQSHVLIKYTDRRSVGRAFAYDSAWRVRSDSVSLGAGVFARDTIRNAARVGLVFTAAGAAPMADTLDVSTLIDGPRTDLTDTTRYWTDRFGAPTRIRNALGHETRLLREEQNYPGLVTKLIYPNGRTVAAFYSSRANVDSTVDLGTCRQMQCATTRFLWDNTWDKPTRVTQPEGDFVEMAYSTVGNPLYQRDGRGASSQADFSYLTTAGVNKDLLQVITYPANPAGARGQETYVYDSITNLGNVMRVITPVGNRTDTYTDGVGRVVATYQDVSGTSGALSTRQVDSMYFDAMDRDTANVSSAPTSLSTFKVTVSKAWNADLLSTLARRQNPSTTDGIAALVTSWSYDSLGRKTREVAPDGAIDSAFYNAAGNVTSAKNRRGQTTTFVYDALGRLSTRTVPSYVGPRDTLQGVLWPGGPYTFPWTPTTGTFTVPGENAAFTYDVLGNLLSADNAHARVRRVYDVSGRLVLDSLITATWDTTRTDRWTKHPFVLRHSYDLNNRQTVLVRPLGDSARLVYNKLFGALDSLLDRGSFGYQYDNLGRVMTRTAPNQVTDSLHYDLDGQLAHRTLRGLQYVGPITGDPTLIHADTLTYDPRGKLMQANTEVYRAAYRYNGLGHADSVRTTPVLGGQTEEEKFFYSPLGNLVMRKWEPLGSGFVDSTIQRYLTASGRVKASDKQPGLTFADSSDYDADGNLTWFAEVHAFTNATYGVTNVQSRAKYYYGADNKLRIADKRAFDSVIVASAGAPERWLNVFEEYRYDAFGRRVVKRAQRRACEALCLSTIERFVWDGDDLIHEKRYPGRWDSPSDSLEVDTGFVKQLVFMPCPPFPGCASDTTYTQPHYGTMTYGYDGAIDRPVMMHRRYFARDTTLMYDSLTLFPHYDAKGNAAGDTKNNAPLDPTNLVNWPAADARVYGLIARGAAPTSWFGSVIKSGQDATGMQYKRNRYYNAEGGRFTQEDPIGLAGGLNLYGFAHGDPVNFSDPFGLCVPYPACAFALAGAGARGGTIIGGVIGALFGPEAIPAGAGLGRIIGALGGIAVGTAGAIWLATRDEADEGSGAKNPDASPKDPGQQFEEIEAAQRAARKGGQPERIKSTKKSKQRDRQEIQEEAERALRDKPKPKP